jgi:hypothetical protein
MKLTKIYLGRMRRDGTLISYFLIREFLAAEVATQYEGFTIHHTEGHWQGTNEPSIIIEILTDPCKYPVDFRPKQIANAYKVKFDQDCVLITTQEVNGELI